MERLGEVTGTPFWIDRRIDSQRRITLVASEQPLAALLDQMARQADLGMVAIDRVVYVGPRTTASLLVRIADESQAAASKGMKRRGVSSWKRLATPRQIAADIAEQAGVTIEDPERIPHDLWSAGATPTMTAGDRLTLLCAGFELRWCPVESDARRVQIEPISEALPRDGLAPLATLLRAKRATPAGESRYTLRIVDKPLGAVLKQLANQLGRELDVAPSLGELDGLIRVEVTQATLEELLNAVGEAGAVSVSAEGGIVVRPLP